MFLVHNERTKLTATWFNGLAAALIATGFFAPMAAVLYGISGLAIGIGYVLAIAVGCVAAGACLHMIGRFILRRLRE